MTRVSIAPPDTEEDVSAERLIESAVVAGRYVHVTTYHDGATPIRAALLFKTAADAATCARVLSKATVGSAVLADIVGPARAASVGARCGDGPSRCYYARRYRPCTTDDITAAVVAAWPNIAAAVGYVGNDPFPLVDGWMGVGFSVRLFGSGEREGAANRVAARVAMDALMVSLARVGFAVSHNGNEWQKGRLILGWADSAARGAGESEE